MNNFIDIHAHILPGVDDGPSTLEESIEMAHMAAKDNISTMVATPHSLNGVFHNTREDIIKKCKDLNRVLENEQVQVKILPGSEVRMSPEVMEGFEKADIMTINDNNMFFYIELPDQFLVDAVMSFLKMMKDKQIIPIISHPERNNGIQGNLDALKLFISAGAMTQATGSSLLGKFGKKSLKCVRKMAEESMIHLVGSDCHSPRERKPELSGAYKRLISWLDKKEVDRIFFENPLKVIENV